MFTEPTDAELKQYMATTESPYIPKPKTSTKTLNDYLELALEKIHKSPAGYIENLTPWIDEMVSKNGKKRLKKILEKYEDTCNDIGITNFDCIRGLYYII